MQHDEMTQMGIDNINALLDSFMGINDSELAEQVCEFLENHIETNNSLIFIYQLTNRFGT